MATNNLAAPTSIGQVVTDNGVSYISFDGLHWFLYEEELEDFDIPQSLQALLNARATKRFFRNSTGQLTVIRFVGDWAPTLTYYKRFNRNDLDQLTSTELLLGGTLDETTGIHTGGRLVAQGTQTFIRTGLVLNSIIVS